MRIDKVFIINLKERIDRKEQIIEELKRVNIQDYEFFEGVRPTDLDLLKWNPEYIKQIPYWFKRTGKNENKYRLGALGCLLSHFEILKMSLQRGYENVLILEDDTIFKLSDNETFDDKISSLNDQLKIVESVFGIIYLTGNHNRLFLSPVSKNLINTRYTLSTGSYIISRRAMEYAVNNIQSYATEVDVFYAEKVQQCLPCFCIYPHISGQRPSYSDIVQEAVNYNFL